MNVTSHEPFFWGVGWYTVFHQMPNVFSKLQVLFQFKERQIAQSGDRQAGLGSGEKM